MRVRPSYIRSRFSRYGPTSITWSPTSATTHCHSAGALTKPRTRLVNEQASKNSAASTIRGEKASYPMPSTGISSDFDHDVATIERVTSGGISGAFTLPATSHVEVSAVLET